MLRHPPLVQDWKPYCERGAQKTYPSLQSSRGKLHSLCGVPTWLWAFSSLKTANCWYFVCMKSRHSSVLELWSVLHLSVALSSTHQVQFIGAHSLTLHVMQDNSTFTFLFYLLMYVLLFCAKDSSKLPRMHIPVCIDCQWQIRSLKISPTCTLGHLAWASSLPWNSICTW
jgi:hypothetical protein